MTALIEKTIKKVYNKNQSGYVYIFLDSPHIDPDGSVQEAA